MSRTLFNQLQRGCLLDEHDCSVQGTAWGVVVEPKCCHGARYRPHWHVVYERQGELFVWYTPKDITDAEFRISGEHYSPPSHIGAAFLDACVLETHRGRQDFFQGKVLDLVKNCEVLTMIEDLRVCLALSREAEQLRHLTRRSWSDRAEIAKAELDLAAKYEKRGKDARGLYEDLLADIHLVKTARTNYASALEKVGQLPQLFLGA
ncbi:hypothetical protein [Kitasatospora cineracea]|uniref:hypothetical protein n=1 Tax=Kitasatospora cineracea TaxID=88074 RepID=UPI0037A1515D